MRRLLIHLAVFASLLAGLSPNLAANNSIPASGTTIKLIPSAFSLITVVGFGGCKFEIDASSSNEKVATVSFAEGPGKKFKVKVEGMDVGSAMITVSTKNGTVQGCEGFEFTFPVEVTADEKAFVKAGKKKLKDAGKAAKPILDTLVKEYCTEIDGLIELAKSGEIPLDIAIELLSIESAFIGGAFNQAVTDIVDQAANDLWTCPEAEGLSEISDSVLGFLPGGCGDWDKFEAGVEALADKAQKKIRAKLKKSIKQLDKIAKSIDAAVLILAQLFTTPPGLLTPVPLPANPAQTPPAAIPKPLRRTAITSGRLSSAGVTRLDISGIGADGAGQVTVSIEGPDGFSDSKMVDLDDACVFQASFDGIKPGHYSVTLTQNGVTTKFTAIAA